MSHRTNPRNEVRTVSELLDRVYASHAAEHALRWGERWLSFDEVAGLAAGMARELLDSGAAPGDRVVVYLENSVLARLVDHALLGFGFVRVALSSRLHPREVAAIVDDAQAAIVCVAGSRERGVRDALNERGSVVPVLDLGNDDAILTRFYGATAGGETRVYSGPGDIAMLMYSSGTTGAPKGVVVTHSAWLAQTEHALSHLPLIGPQDVVVLGAPMPHFGGSVALDCAMRGARTVVVEPFDASRVLDAVERHGGTVLPLVPTLLARLVDALPGREESVATVRSVPYGGSPAPVDVLARAARCFPGALTQFYGLAEALAPLTVLTPDDHDRAARDLAEHPHRADVARTRLQSAGRWIPEIEHRDDDGVLKIRGPVVMPGYWRRDELTASVLNDGWFSTGDIGCTDDAGYLHIFGRRSDLIISGGFNIHPREVEQVIEEIDGIAEVAVVGLADERWGEGVHAFAVLEASASVPISRDELARLVREACLARIASYKKPVGVHVVDALPRNSFGKVDRAALREAFRPESTTDPQNPTNEMENP
ncbi:class I adenylate-forming enzyme family protein [Saxibacter everestensis]|uniref:Class I adenylate-forming enzyme family protein n=1 Tax=Saxibacter everestensis TaxID=2909229 RepID=A0ABY8QV73_9MICO|nr:class I adenylate-forming enzyme family protein [Brevibacteriaceae bacterium ZFBP1038]